MNPPVSFRSGEDFRNFFVVSEPVEAMEALARVQGCGQVWATPAHILKRMETERQNLPGMHGAGGQQGPGVPFVYHLNDIGLAPAAFPEVKRLGDSRRSLYSLAAYVVCSRDPFRSGSRHLGPSRF